MYAAMGLCHRITQQHIIGALESARFQKAKLRRGAEQRCSVTERIGAHHDVQFIG